MRTKNPAFELPGADDRAPVDFVRSSSSGRSVESVLGWKIRFGENKWFL